MRLPGIPPGQASRPRQHFGPSEAQSVSCCGLHPCTGREGGKKLGKLLGVQPTVARASRQPGGAERSPRRIRSTPRLIVGDAHPTLLSCRHALCPRRGRLRLTCRGRRRVAALPLRGRQIAACGSGSRPGETCPRTSAADLAADAAACGGGKGDVELGSRGPRLPAGCKSDAGGLLGLGRNSSSQATNPCCPSTLRWLEQTQSPVSAQPINPGPHASHPPASMLPQVWE